MGGSGRGSGLEAEQAGDGSPSEPTVLKEVELPEPLGEAMLGAAEAAEVGSKVRASQTQSYGSHSHPHLANSSHRSLLYYNLSSLILYLSGFFPLWGLDLHCFFTSFINHTAITMNLSN